MIHLLNRTVSQTVPGVANGSVFLINWTVDTGKEFAMASKDIQELINNSANRNGVDGSLMETIISFGEFAKANGYQIPPDYARNAFTALADMPADNLSFATSEPVLKTVIVKTPAEAQRFHNDFINFCKNRISYAKEMKEAREALKNVPSAKREAQRKLTEASQKLRQDKMAFEQHHEQGLKLKAQKAGKLQQAIDDHEGDFEKLFGQEAQYGLLKKIGTIANNDDPAFKMKLVDCNQGLRKSIIKGMDRLFQTDDPAAMLDICEAMATVLKKAKQNQKKLEREFQNFKKREAQLAQQQQEINDMEANAQQRLRSLLNKLSNNQTDSGTQIVKEHSLSHRSVFDSDTARNAVISFDEGIPAFMDKDFAKLTNKEKQQLNDYIRQNARNFRTRINGRINTTAHRRIDMAETCKQACRTNGIPLNLAFDRPKRQKANIVMLLDISGSCRSASELMLTFMYQVKKVFPGGCKSYAFVNSLYDISKLFDVPDSDSAIREVLNTIPTKGVYSDYGRPLKEYREQHMSDINKDTIILWIGDARNNRNPSEAETFKNIVRRGKKTYWLNTEKKSQWNHGDSIFSEYARYCTKYAEAISPAELIGFLTQM